MATTDHESDYTGPEPRTGETKQFPIVSQQAKTGPVQQHDGHLTDEHSKPNDTMFSPVLREFFGSLIERHTAYLEAATKTMEAAANQYRTAENAAQFHRAEIDRLTADFHNA